MENRKIGFIGAGGIARAHVFALNALKFYYDDVPDAELKAVSSAREESRQAFAKKYGFEKALDIDSLLEYNDLDTVYILGPNNVHYPHLEAVLKMDNVQRIYLEKPICSTFDEEQKIQDILKHTDSGKDIRVGFQMLFSSAVRKALDLWHSNLLGRPVHFRFN